MGPRGRSVTQIEGSVRRTSARTESSEGNAVNSSTLLDVDQAAHRLGGTVRWMRRAVAQRRIPFVKIGHYVRFVPEELDAFIERNRVEQAHFGAASPRR